LITVEQALEKLGSACAALATIDLTPAEALGRGLAQPLVADRDFPPTDRSAMDGFAVIAADLGCGETELQIVGEQRAGQPESSLTLESGQAMRIMTGAIVPRGADAVVMVERSRPGADLQRISLKGAAVAGQHIRTRGNDLRQGDPVLEAGVQIEAPHVAALTSIGATTVQVHREPRVHVISTGDEIVEPEQTPAPHQVRNSNAHTLLAQLKAMRIHAHYDGIAADDPDLLRASLESGLAGDLLLVTGGVSAGKYDLVSQTLAELGVEQLFHKVAMKPGKPILAGRRERTIVLGLPGNPVSTYACFLLFARPVLRRMSGLRDWKPSTFEVRLSAAYGTRPGREVYGLGRLHRTHRGLEVEPVASTGSGDVLSMAQANAFIVTPAEGASYAAGARVQVLAWHDPISG
jgi:molybdopterin molybdotransferase